MNNEQGLLREIAPIVIGAKLTNDEFVLIPE